MIFVLGDLIADLVLHIARFPIDAEHMRRADFVDLGPGGATNVAIAASRLGLKVGCLGEVGGDQFGRIVIEGLEREGVDVSEVIVTADASTPLAAVLVDEQAEPAYVGYRGSLTIHSLVASWRSRIQEAQALFVNGWADHEHVQDIVLQGLKEAREAGVPVFFDPGPDNHEFDIAWHQEAAAIATVLLANEQEAARLSANAYPSSNGGPELVFVKRGSLGCLFRTVEGETEVPGFNVEVVDTTAAGDSFDAAVIYGYLSDMQPTQVAMLANAAGAAKVRKRGTGHQVPTADEIRKVLKDAGLDPTPLSI